MPWLIGIDEAGYGPNLGPLVMTSVACRVRDGGTGARLWKDLRKAVRRPHEEADARLVVEDSKVVYTNGGLARLEAGVLGTVLLPDCGSILLSDCLGRVAPAGRDELGGEPWYSGATQLPLTTTTEDNGPSAALFARACVAARVQWGVVHSVIVCPARFNLLLDRWGTKGAILGVALRELLHVNLGGQTGPEPIAFCIDKHGGRNTYAAMLQEAVPAGLVLAHEESSGHSSYSVVGIEREVSLVFEPRADANHFCVALASMVSKYLREVLMHEFNAFWQKHVPELKPTAGYPVDAKRYYEAIRPVMERLGVSEECVWRRR